MKNIGLYILPFAIVLVAGCNLDNESDHHFSNKLFINTSSNSEQILFKGSEETVTEVRDLTVGTALPVENQVSATFVYAPELLDVYNRAMSKEAVLLPDGIVSIDKAGVTIEKGNVKSTVATVKFSGTDKLQHGTLYVAPIALRDIQGLEALDSKTIVYYVFKGAALINVVCDISQQYFSVSWNNPAVDFSKMDVITVEALIRVKDFGLCDGKKEEAISTIFGREDKDNIFLVRVGDAAVENNQLQIVTGKKDAEVKFPQRNASYGLPVNEWVHIAAVWDATTGDRIIYHNGKKIVADKGAEGTVNLQRGCYIGRSYNDSRWLEGNISELRVWKSQRTQKEIADNIYQLLTPIPDENLLAYWKFNEGTGRTVKDYSRM